MNSTKVYVIAPAVKVLISIILIMIAIQASAFQNPAMLAVRAPALAISHALIELPTDLDATISNKIRSQIERKLMPELNRFITQRDLQVSSIEIIVGMDGSVAIARINGTDLSQETKETITHLIKKEAYSKFNLVYVWKYKILF